MVPSPRCTIVSAMSAESRLGLLRGRFVEVFHLCGSQRGSQPEHAAVARAVPWLMAARSTIGPRRAG